MTPLVPASLIGTSFERCREGGFFVPTVEERFWSKVDPCRTDGCAIWLGTHQAHGYGKFYPGFGVQLLAHHFLVGKPPAGLEWDHVKERGCENRDCVWPAHLELVTHAENVRRGMKATQTHCIHGHPFDDRNTYRYRGKRHCKACTLERIYAQRAKRKGYYDGHPTEQA